MKKKIISGFLLIGSLLLLSGVISFFEMQKLRKATEYLMVKSRQVTDLSKQMLDGVQEQNTALLMSMTDSLNAPKYAKMIQSGHERFIKAYEDSRLLFPDAKELDTLLSAGTAYENVIGEMMSDKALINNITIFADVYQTSYSSLTHSIKNFMILSQHGIQDYASDIEGKGYRTYIIGILVLVCGALLVIMFYFLLNYYFLSPVIRITNSLNKYLTAKIPFNVTVDSNDEILKLKENIEELIDSAKSKSRQ